MYKCEECGKTKSIDKFHTSKYLEKKIYPICKECTGLTAKQFFNKLSYVKEKQKILTNTVRKRNLLYVLEHLSKNSCIDCGESNPVLLDLDHVRGKKICCISKLSHQSYSIDKIKEEINKCEVRCVNCHRIKTSRELSFYKSRLQGKK